MAFEDLDTSLEHERLAEDSNLPPFNVPVPPGVDPEEFARQIAEQGHVKSATGMRAPTFRTLTEDDYREPTGNFRTLTRDDYERTSVGEAMEKGAKSGVYNTAAAANTALEWLGKRVGSETLAKIGRENYDFWTKMAEPHGIPDDLAGDLLDDMSLLADPAWLAYSLVQGGISMIPSLVVGAGVGGAAFKGLQILGKTYKLTPKLLKNLSALSGAVPAGLVGGGQEGASTYREMLARGATEEQAARAMEAMTTFSGLLNAFSFDKMGIFKKTPIGDKKKITGFIAHVLTAGGTEAMTEYGEEPIELMIKHALLPEGITKEEVVQQLRSGVNVIPSAGILGAVGGAAGYSKPSPINNQKPTNLLEDAKKAEEAKKQEAAQEPAGEETVTGNIFDDEEIITPEQEAKLSQPAIDMLHPAQETPADLPSAETVTEPSEEAAPAEQLDTEPIDGLVTDDGPVAERILGDLETKSMLSFADAFEADLKKQIEAGQTPVSTIPGVWEAPDDSSLIRKEKKGEGGIFFGDQAIADAMGETREGAQVPIIKDISKKKFDNIEAYIEPEERFNYYGTKAWPAHFTVPKFKEILMKALVAGYDGLYSVKTGDFLLPTDEMLAEVTKLREKNASQEQTTLKKLNAQKKRDDKKSLALQEEEAAYKKGAEAIGATFDGFLDTLPGRPLIPQFTIPVAGGQMASFSPQTGETVAQAAERIKKSFLQAEPAPKQRGRKKAGPIQVDAAPTVLTEKDLPTASEFFASKGFKPTKKTAKMDMSQWFQSLYKANPTLTSKTYQSLLDEWQTTMDESMRDGVNYFTTPKTKPAEPTLQDQIPETVEARLDLVPGWTIEYNKNAVEGVTIDTATDTIVFKKKADYENPAKVNDAVAEIVVASLPAEVIDAYGALLGIEPTGELEINPAKAELIVDYGMYLNGLQVSPESKAFFEEQIHAARGGVVKEQRTREGLANDIIMEADSFGAQINTLKRGPMGILNRATRVMVNFVQAGFMNFVGQRFGGLHDLAAMAQIYRDERVETFRYFLTKKGKVVGEVGFSSRLPGTSQVIQDGDVTKLVGQIRAKAMRFGADNVVMLHNHPSGRPVPSTLDAAMTREVARQLATKSGVKFGGHIVINSTQYSVIDNNGDHKMWDLPKGVVEKFGKRKEFHPPLHEVEDVAKLGQSFKRQEGYVTVFYTSATGYINNVQDVPIGLLKSPEAANFLRGQAREYGGNQIVMYLDNINHLGVDVAKHLIAQGSATDVIYGHDGSIKEKHFNYLESASPEETLAKALGKFYVKEDAVGLKPPPTMADIEREGYAKAERSIVELPEMLFLVKGLTGSFPKIRKYLGKQLGVFREETGEIDLLAGLSQKDYLQVLAHNIGHLVEWLPDSAMKQGNVFAKIAAIQGYMKNTLAEHSGAPGQPLTTQEREAIRREAQRDAKKPGETLYEYVTRSVDVFAETDITPEMILQLLRGLTNQPKEVLDYLKSVDGPTKASIVKQAFKGVVDEEVQKLRARVKIGVKRETTVKEVRPEDINIRIARLFKEKLQAEVVKRKLFIKEEVLEELRALSVAWNKFEPLEGDPYTAKRFSPSELYADAVSVLFNDPQFLQEQAPIFWKTFFNYMEARPQFKAKYDSLQKTLKDEQAIKQNRQDFLEGMAELDRQRMEADRIKKEAKERITWKGLWHDIRKHIDTKNVRYIERVQERIDAGFFVHDSERIDYWIDQLPRISAEVFAYVKESQFAMKALRDHKISMDQFSAYLTLQRSAFDLRRSDTEKRQAQENEAAAREGRAAIKVQEQILSPGGIGGSIAEQQIAYMEQQLGPTRAKAIAEIADKFRSIYQERVVKVVVESGMFDESLNDFMLKNPYYVTFDHLSAKLDERFGKATTATILGQYGGVGEIGNVMVSTMLKGMSLLRAARYNNAKVAVKETLTYWQTPDALEIRPAESTRSKTGERWQTPPEGFGLIEIMENGERKGYWIDAEMAQTFNTDPDKAGAMFKIGIISKQIITKLFIGWNLPWVVGNIVRDMIGTWKKLPPGEHTSVFKAYMRTFGEAWRSVFDNDQLIEREMKLLRERSLPPGHWYDGEGVLNELQDNLLSMDQKGMIAMNAAARRDARDFYGKYKTVIDWLGKEDGMNKYLLVPPALRFIEKLGMVGERWGKFAGDEFLTTEAEIERQLEPDYYEQPLYRSYLMGNRVGTPNFLQEGLWTKWAEVIFPFSRVAIQDIVSGVSAYKESHQTYIMKTLIANVMPKLFLGILAAGLIPGDLGDELKEKARKITTYYRRLYTVIPLFDVGDQVAFLKIPQDFTGQAIGAVVDAAISGDIAGTTGTLGAVAGYQPYNLNPFISAASDWFTYYTTKQVPVNFYGSPIMSKLAAERGGTEAAKALMRSTWNEFFGGLLMKIDAGGADRVEPAIKKVLKATPVNALGKFIGITDTGRQEEARKWGEKFRADKAGENLATQRAAIEIINEYPEERVTDKLIELWMRRVEDGVIDPSKQSARDFVKTYMLVEKRTTGSASMMAFSRGETSAEKADHLIRHEAVYGTKSVNKLINELSEAGLMTKSVWREYAIQQERASGK